MAKIAADFLGVSVEGLEKAVCTRSTITRGETIVSPVSASNARDVCDAFVKGVYGRMFIWIVNKINQVIFKPKVSKKKKKTVRKVQSCGVKSALKLTNAAS